MPYFTRGTCETPHRHRVPRHDRFNIRIPSNAIFDVPMDIFCIATRDLSTRTTRALFSGRDAANERKADASAVHHTNRDYVLSDMISR